MINRRVQIRQGLHPLIQPAFDALCERLGPEWQPYSGRRTFNQQDQLYAMGRIKNADGTWRILDENRLRTKAKAGESPHNYALAHDWTKFDPSGKPIWFLKEDPVWQEFIDAVVSVGLRSGAEFGDPDHAELRIAVPWTTIKTVFFDKGPNAAYAAVEASMIPMKGDDK